MSEPLAQLLALVIEIESNQESDAERDTRLDAQDVAEKFILEEEYPITDEDYEGKSSFYIS